MTIPKIIHQLWIGPLPPPIKYMNSWKEKHENDGFEYIYWNEIELEKRGFKPQLIDKVIEMEEINGKADILRWEILYEYGGVFVDADSYCMEPINYLVEKYEAFAGYENEIVRGKGWCDDKKYDDVLASTHPLIATGTMAFPPKHELPRLAIEWIKNNETSVTKTKKRAWRTVGPGLLTRLYWSKKWDDIIILPSYYFLPVHASGHCYNGHGKIYAHQEWGSTKQSYHLMNSNDSLLEFKKPEDKVSILISSYNTKAAYIRNCLDSIKQQEGEIFMEVIWINDGSNEINTKVLKKMLDDFENTTRNIKVVYDENDGNKGIGYTLNKGIKMCSNEIIMKMDSDDIMVPKRIQLQLNYMKEHPEVAICGGQVVFFKEKINNGYHCTQHKTITWDNFKKHPTHWFINHPTVCYKKSAVLMAGNYNESLKQMAEDFELELRMLKKFGTVYNMTETLVWYRSHSEQVTAGAKNDKEGAANSKYWNDLRNKMIANLID